MPILEPVQLGGVTIRQASLHNFDDLARKDIREGDMVVVQRAGDVIPQVVGPVVALRSGAGAPFAMPAHLPGLRRAGGCARKGEVAVYCVNAACPAQVVRRIEHWVSRGAMDIEGLGEQGGRAAGGAGLVQDVADLYTLTRRATVDAGGLCRQTRRQPVAGHRRQPRHDRCGACLPAWASTAWVARWRRPWRTTMARSMRSWPPAWRNARDRWHRPADRQDVVAFFSSRAQSRADRKAAPHGVRLAEEPQARARPGPLEGMTFVITGTLPSMSREAADGAYPAARRQE